MFGPPLVLDRGSIVWCSQKVFESAWCNRRRCRVELYPEDVVCRSEQWRARPEGEYQFLLDLDK